MEYRVEITARAARDLASLFHHINAEDSLLARDWFNSLQESILSLREHPARCPVTPENPACRHLLYGKRSDVYRIIFTIDERRRVVSVLHIRHGARQPFKGSLE